MKYLILSASALAVGVIMVLNAVVLQKDYMIYFSVGFLIIVALSRKSKEIQKSIISLVPESVRLSYYTLIIILIIVVLSGIVEAVLGFEKVLFRNMVFELSLAIGAVAISLENIGRYILSRSNKKIK